MEHGSSAAYIVMAVLVIGVRLLALLFPRGTGARTVLRVLSIAVSVACVAYLYYMDGKL